MKFIKSSKKNTYRLVFLFFVIFRIFNSIYCFSEEIKKDSFKKRGSIKISSEKNKIKKKEISNKSDGVTFLKYLIKDNSGDEVIIVVDEKSSNKPYSINFSPVMKIKQSGRGNKIILNKYGQEEDLKNKNKSKKINVKNVKPILKRKIIKKPKIVPLKSRNTFKKSFAKKKKKIVIFKKPIKENNNEEQNNEEKEEEEDIQGQQRDDLFVSQNNEDEEIEVVENYYGTKKEIDKIKNKQNISNDDMKIQQDSSVDNDESEEIEDFNEESDESIENESNASEKDENK